MSGPARYRFAPSPTGYLHVGGARMAVLNWLLARHAGGTFVLRVEDTDVERNVVGAEAAVLADLRWLGLEWDEGPDVGGPAGPYRQSERGEIYRGHAADLLRAGHAYPCTCPPGEAAGETRRVRCPCADRAGETSVPEGASLRFRVPEARQIRVVDAVRGDVAFSSDTVEDFVLLRSDGRPTYNFAAVVDDGEMRITHVVRGADHLLNTPKQQLLYDALGWPLPRFAHVPLILGPDRQKLSKRHGATSVAEHRRIGYLAESLVNYLSLLSWSSPSGEEFLPLDRLVAEIGLDRVGASDAVFDPEKLRWLSGRYVQALPLDELVERLRPFLAPATLPEESPRLPAAVQAVRHRVALLTELAGELRFFFGPRSDEQRAARHAALEDPDARRVLDAVAHHLASLEEWTDEAIGQAVRDAGKVANARGRNLFHPLRLALTGEERGPELPTIIRVQGRALASRLLSPETDTFDEPDVAL